VNKVEVNVLNPKPIKGFLQTGSNIICLMSCVP